MAELHLLGYIEGAYQFENKTSLFCRYTVQSGPNWTIVSGYPEGQSTTCKPDQEGHILWSQPLDLHFIAKGIQGWPKIQFQVCCLDSLGRSWTEGYSFCSVPTVPGYHEITIPSWAPTAVNITDRIRQYFLGGSQQLVNTDIINLGIDRFKLKTKSKGYLRLKLEVVLRNFSHFGVEYK